MAKRSSGAEAILALGLPKRRAKVSSWEIISSRRTMKEGGYRWAWKSIIMSRLL